MMQGGLRYERANERRRHRVSCAQNESPQQHPNPRQVCDEIYHMNITGLMVEGGLSLFTVSIIVVCEASSLVAFCSNGPRTEWVF